MNSEKKKMLVEKQLVSLRVLAARWGCSRKTVRRALSKAGIKPVFISDQRNGTLRYIANEVEKFLQDCRGMEVSME